MPGDSLLTFHAVLTVLFCGLAWALPAPWSHLAMLAAVVNLTLAIRRYRRVSEGG